jgi:chaperone required for assembly of F1-ATPase
MKRFYKDVTVTPAGGIMLDGRTVRTPARAELVLPNGALAAAIAEEWRNQGEEIDPHSMPLTGLANAAIDHAATDPQGFAARIAVYGETELLCYRAGDPPELVARQNAVWNPLLDWVCARYGVAFTTVTGIMHQHQPPATVERLSAAVAAFSPFTLTALSPIVTIGGSLVIGLALYEDAVTPDAAFDVAHLDELWQAELWGEDDFALEARAAHRRDFLAGCDVLRLLR